MIYCFFHCQSRRFEYNETLIIREIVKDVPTQRHNARFQILSPVINDVFWSQDLLPL